MDLSGYVKPKLKRDHRALYWALWFLWFCVISFTLSAVYRLWPAEYAYYYDYYNYASRAETIVALLSVAFVVITGAGAVLGMIGSDKVVKDEKKLLDGQTPMNRTRLLDVFSGLVFDKPTDASSTYTVVLHDYKKETDYLVRITSELYIELKEFYDQGFLGFVLGENFK